MLSIVIPTLNEEKYLPRLLNCLKKQKFKDYEVIVADADSKDKTREIAKDFGHKVVKGGLPSVGRNIGEQESRGNLILFLDADILLPDDFLKNILKEFKERNLSVAALCSSPISKSRILKFLFNVFYNYPLLIFGKKWPHGMQAVLIEKSLHKKIGGWDETIILLEDCEYFKRASKVGRFGTIKTTKIFSSLRRFRDEGLIPNILKYGFANLYLEIKGPLRKNFLKYKFNYLKDGKP